MPAIAAHAGEIPRSGIRAIMDRAWLQTEPVIGLHVGEPSFATPKHVLDAAAEAMAKGRTRYVANAGLPELRAAIADKVRDRNGIDAATEQVVVGAGGVQALHVAMSAIVRTGDEVLVPDPGWPNFAMATRMLQARPVLYRLHAGNDFLPDPPELARLVTPRTRAIMVNSPANPLGTVLDETLVRRLVELAEDNDLWLVSDECYEAFTFEGPHVSPAAHDTAGRVLSCFSFSKTYAMTGMRVGYLVAPPAVATVCAKLQEPMISCVSVPAQYAALAALTGPQEHVASARETYRDRRDAAAALLDAAGLPYLFPRGAFYLWLDVSSRLAGRLRDVTDWAIWLLDNRQVAVAPGTSFGPGGAGWVRISLATETDDLLEGLRRIAG
jgi:aspartate aminotransferase